MFIIFLWNINDSERRCYTAKVLQWTNASST